MMSRTSWYLFSACRIVVAGSFFCWLVLLLDRSSLSSLVQRVLEFILLMVAIALFKDWMVGYDAYLSRGGDAEGDQ